MAAEVYAQMLAVRGDIIIATCRGRRGHPVLFSSHLIPEILRYPEGATRRDFTEPGDDDKLGPPDGITLALLIDVLHGSLWLMENRPALLDQPLAGRAEQLRLVAQTLAGPALAGEGSRLTASRGAEAGALRKLTPNSRSPVGENLFRQRAQGQGGVR